MSEYSHLVKYIVADMQELGFSEKNISAEVARIEELGDEYTLISFDCYRQMSNDRADLRNESVTDY